MAAIANKGRGESAISRDKLKSMFEAGQRTQIDEDREYVSFAIQPSYCCSVWIYEEGSGIWNLLKEDIDEKQYAGRITGQEEAVYLSH